MRRLNRVAPQLPPTAMDTYAIVAPQSTHWRDATCDDAGCPALANGWRTTVDERASLGQGQAYYIRRQSGRRFTEQRTADGLTVFTFPAGQQCFRQHRVRTDRPELYLARRGDWRTPVRRDQVKQYRAEDWVDRFANNQDRLSQIIRRG